MSKRLGMHCCILFLLIALPQIVLHHVVGQTVIDYPTTPTANLSSTWTTNRTGSVIVSRTFNGDYVKAVILHRSTPKAVCNFVCGFYCPPGHYYAFLFAVVIVSPQIGDQVVWSANRELVGDGATLELTAEGNLVLQDRGSVVWETGTSGMSVVGMSLEQSGNLRLIGSSGETVWQSFDHPTDELLSGQVLSEEQRLLPNESPSSWRPSPILYLTPDGAFANATPPQMYATLEDLDRIDSRYYPCSIKMRKGSLVFIVNSTASGRNMASNVFLRFESNGHLKLYEWQESPYTTKWAVTEVFSDMENCDYPTVCGDYGICSRDVCTCPEAYFRSQEGPNLERSCAEITPLTCTPEFHTFLPLKNVSYFDSSTSVDLMSEEKCKRACLMNCSCKAAVFEDFPGVGHYICYLLTKLFSLRSTPLSLSHNATTFLKVQIAPPGLNSTAKSKGAFNSTTNSNGTFNSTLTKKAAATVPVGSIVGLVVGSSVALVFITSVVTVWLKKKKIEEHDNEDEANRFYQLPGMPTRFSYQELTTATDNFKQILGKGGFATVFEGALSNGVKVAVKRLEGVLQITKEFLAEVQIIGRIHHVNLVGLIGFCTEKSHRILLYEYMQNGSLDRWIFHMDQKDGGGLSWEVRKKIIYQVARGLFYLHEECNPRIYHLDIKPQNILLDGDFNAKVSDFGLSKFIDGGQSFVMTTMRGTPGYLAPEWLLTSKITDKVDVYSFGVVLIEVVCQRRNLDNTLSGDSVHLMKLLNNMAGEGLLKDFAGRYCLDIDNYELLEVIEMLKLAIWCLQSDADERPTMAMVVKVLEETMEVPDMEMNFLAPTNRMEWIKEIDSSSSAPLMTSVLSGPR